jgi:hypothetical protein
MKCTVCNKDPAYFQWTDTHGIGACRNCGMPYTLLHYEHGTNTPLDLPPSPALSEKGIMLARRYWHETGRRTFPGYYDMMGVSRRRGNRTYSGATEEEMQLFDAWYNALPPADKNTAEDAL